MKKFIISIAILICAVIAVCFAGCYTHSGGGISNYTYSNSAKYSVGGAEIAEKVEKISVDWPVGKVNISTNQTDKVTFSENSEKELTDDTRLHYWLDGATLNLKFCKSGRWNFSEMEKDLTLTVPASYLLKEFDIDGVSSEVRLDGIKADSVSVDTTSGDIKLVACFVNKLVDIDTVSGGTQAELLQALDVFDGDTTSGNIAVNCTSITDFDADTVSGSVDFTCTVAPKNLDIETNSGNVELELPQNSSFTLYFDTVSGELNSALSMKKDGGKYIFGNGTDAYDIETTSGNLKISAV